jgi:hypothetical protein
MSTRRRRRQQKRPPNAVNIRSIPQTKVEKKHNHSQDIQQITRDLQQLQVTVNAINTRVNNFLEFKSLQDNKILMTMTATALERRDLHFSLDTLKNPCDHILQSERVLLIISEKRCLDNVEYVPVRRVFDDGTVQDFWSVFRQNNTCFFDNFKVST